MCSVGLFRSLEDSLSFYQGNNTHGHQNTAIENRTRPSIISVVVNSTITLYITTGDFILALENLLSILESENSGS